jgi:hypothetical protein
MHGLVEHRRCACLKTCRRERVKEHIGWRLARRRDLQRLAADVDALRAPAPPAAPQAAPEPRRDGGQSDTPAGAAPDDQDSALGGPGSPAPQAARPSAAVGAPAAAAQRISAQGEEGREAGGAAALAARLAVLEDALGSLGAAQAAAHGHVSGAMHAITARLAALQARRPRAPRLCLTCHSRERLPGLHVLVPRERREPGMHCARAWSRASARSLCTAMRRSNAQVCSIPQRTEGSMTVFDHRCTSFPRTSLKITGCRVRRRHRMRRRARAVRGKRARAPAGAPARPWPASGSRCWPACSAAWLGAWQPGQSLVRLHGGGAGTHARPWRLALSTRPGPSGDHCCTLGCGPQCAQRRAALCSAGSSVRRSGMSLQCGLSVLILLFLSVLGGRHTLKPA